jgi:hypothetical protein
VARPRKWLPGDPTKPIILRYHRLPTIRGMRRFLKDGDLSGVLDYKPMKPNVAVKEVLREHRAILSALVSQRRAVMSPLLGPSAQRLLDRIDPATGKHRYTQSQVAKTLGITQAKLQRQLRDWEDYRSARKSFLKKPRPNSR